MEAVKSVRGGHLMVSLIPMLEQKIAKHTLNIGSKCQNGYPFHCVLLKKYPFTMLS